MYATTIQDIKVPFLHDAALVLSLREDDKGEKIYKFCSLYMDRSGECAISYYGHLTEQQIKEVMINFCYPGEDKSYDEIHPTMWKDYEFENGNFTARNPDCTTIYTPKGLDYRTLLNTTMDTNNKSVKEIRQMYDDLLESIRHNLSLKLMDTSENDPLEVYIPLEHGAVGLSTLEMPTITKIYQHPSEGIIYVHFDGDDYDTELDNLYMEDIIQILKELEQ